jgi:hypothetical protein
MTDMNNDFELSLNDLDTVTGGDGVKPGCQCGGGGGGQNGTGPGTGGGNGHGGRVIWAGGDGAGAVANIA